MQSVENKIEKTIKSKPKGYLLFSEDFSHRGSAESVRKALQNLKEKGLIKSVAHGIYVRPVKDEYIGEVLPTAEEVAKAIARRDKIKLVPTGAYAMHALGLSTQIPLKLVYLTDGAPRIIKVGNRTIKLKKATPKNLKAKGKISSLVIQALREILLYFSPSVMLALGPVLLQNGHPVVRKMIMEVMEYLCLKDMSKLETLLDHPDQKLAEELLPLLSKLRGENSYRIFFKMSEHSSEKVREEAVRVLLDRNPQSVLKLFPLIDDPSMKIRRHILAGVAKQKSFVLENLLLKYIIENVSHENTEYILSCYKALGGCCSKKSIPYLHKVLLTRGWNRFVGLGKPVHREGAATALLLLNNQQARDILDKGADSRFKVIRQAIQRATAKNDVSGDSSHG